VIDAGQRLNRCVARGLQQLPPPDWPTQRLRGKLLAKTKASLGDAQY
jgi:hypothetical protein